MMKFKRFGIGGGAAVFVVAFGGTAFGTTRSYTGGYNSSVASAGHWDPNGAPGSGDVATVGDRAVSGLSGDLHVTLNGVFLDLSSITFDSLALPAALVVNETGGTLSATTENLGVDAF